MIDTISIVSPVISDEDAKKIEKNCILRQGIDLSSGEILYELTTGSLEGSFDSRIRVDVRREKNIYSDGSLYTLRCEPYIIIEGSVHKAMLGHNVFGGPIDFKKSCQWFLKKVSELVGFCLPDFDLWNLKRVDVAEVFQMKKDGIFEWFRAMNTAQYPRRKVHRYGNTGLYCSGKTTTIKFYHKGSEFKKHDKGRLSKYWPSDDVVRLELIADNILRVEVEIKSDKLRYDFGDLPKLVDVDNIYIERIFDEEVKKILKEGQSGMRVVRTRENVENRIYEVYGPRMGYQLLGTWSRLAIYDEDQVKRQMSNSTFYRHLKMLREAGVSWKCTDVITKDFELVINTKFPEDFTPQRNDIRRLCEQSEKVKELLKAI